MATRNPDMSASKRQFGQGSERKALSSAVVRCITGDIDDQSVVDIISTGASEQQLMQAVMQFPAVKDAGDGNDLLEGAHASSVTLKLTRILSRSQSRSFPPRARILTTGVRKGQP